MCNSELKKSICAEEVGYHFLEIFTIFGAPCILHSDNGREFTNYVINEVFKMWCKLKIVHSQSQGSVKRANQYIKIMLATWLETSKTTHWSKGLKFIQIMKNKAFNSEINTSPYETMFRCKTKLGLKIFIPDVDIPRISTEEDLEKLQDPQDTLIVPNTSDSSHHTSDVHLVGT